MKVRFHFTRGEASEGHIRDSSWHEAQAGKVQALSVWADPEHVSEQASPTVEPNYIVRFWSLNRLERL